jgi:flagellar biosynthesis/type III secretory pathway chaperone
LLLSQLLIFPALAAKCRCAKGTEFCEAKFAEYFIHVFLGVYYNYEENIMPGLVENLIETLNKEADLYAELVELSEQKKQCIINNDVEGLRQIVAKENTTTSRAIREDKERVVHIKDICLVLNKKEADMTLSHLVVLLEGQPEHEDLTAVVERLKELATTLKSLNEDNKILLEFALEYIDYNMNVIHSSIDAGPVAYDRGGHEIVGETGGFLDING